MKNFDKETIEQNKELLLLLSDSFKNANSCMAELVRLRATLKLPKATEHFLSDIHGEYESFGHVLRSCSGNIRRRAAEVIGPNSSSALRLSSEEDLSEFCSMVFYPQESLKRLKQDGRADGSYYRLAILRLVKLFEVVARKYAQYKVEAALSPDLSFIVRELVYRNPNQEDRQWFYAEIVEAIIDTGFSENVICELCKYIQMLNVDRLHILGDIYDRGRGPHFIMDTLMDFSSVDIQWGNHDILWLGAAAGNLACIANCVRICMRYANTSVLESGYGINFYPLLQFADRTYSGSEAELMKFMPIESDETSDISKVLLAKMQKAMSVIQFKLESAAIRRNPGYGMDSRMIVDTINIGDRTALLGGVRFPLNCSDFPTIGQAGQSLLTKEEEDVIQSLRTSFMASEKLQRHAKYLLSHGSVYLCYNGNLLMHAGLPIDDSLNFREVSLCGQQLKGKALLDFIDRKVRQSFSDEEDEEKDLFWFLWCSPDSPLFGKDKMATFERYFIDDKSEHKESTPLFYRHLDDEALADALLKEFGLAAAHSHIVCGHVPVKAGESPIKANGKILCIDLGYSQAYQKETGLAGCTLTYNSIGLTLMLHEQKKEQGAAEAGPGRDMSDRLVNVEELGMENRLRVSDTEDGKRMQKEIDRLEMLLEAYSRGTIAQSNG